jgi:hypothetical protein
MGRKIIERQEGFYFAGARGIGVTDESNRDNIGKLFSLF